MSAEGGEREPASAVYEVWRYALPQPLSAHHKRRFERADDVQRLECAIAQFEATLEFIACVALADLMASYEAEDLSECGDIIWMFNNAGAGKLLSLFDEAMRRLRRNRRAFVIGFDTLADRASTWRSAFDSLVVARNDITHDARGLSAARASNVLRGLAPTIGVFESAVGSTFGNHLLGWIDPSRNVAGVAHFDFFPLRGVQRVEDLMSLRGAAHLPDGVPILLSEDRTEALTLAPLIQWASPPETASRYSGEARCVVLTSIDGDRTSPRFTFRDALEHRTHTLEAEALAHELKPRLAEGPFERPRRLRTGLDPDSVLRCLPPLIGPLLLRDRYQFLGCVGRGATGEVWAARCRSTGASCAVKVLQSASAFKPETRRRFKREIDILEAVNHRGIVRFRRSGEDRQGIPYLELEFVEGQSLDRFMADHGPLPPEDAVGFTLNLLDALEVAHNAGVLHRDVGPRNIIRRPTGQPCLVDFGLAWVPNTDGMTRHGLGTDRFSAPEQLRGCQAEATSDVYSVGRVLQALLTGGDPDGPTPTGPFAARLAPVLRRATHETPSERYPSAAAMREALLIAMTPTPPPTTPGTTMPMTIEALQRLSHDLQTWFDDSFNPFLQRWSHGDRATALRSRIELLGTLVKHCDEEQAFCFLGASGVGKSTLINALAARNQTVLPHGGVGPLTAQATVVRPSESLSLKVRYVEPGRLNGVRLALEQQVERESSGARDGAHDGAHDDDGLTEQMEMLRRQAALLVTGEQFSSARPSPSNRYLVDALRRALGQKPRWDEPIREEDQTRIDRIAAALRTSLEGGVYQPDFQGDRRAFREAVSLHAKGHLAPLILQLEVGWPSEDVEPGIALVDLPGLGVDGDTYRKVTEKWVREESRGVVLVVDRAGVTESVARLLRECGFWGRLHHQAENLAEAPSLMVVMVKADEVATAERRQELEAVGKEVARPWNQHLQSTRDTADGFLRDQIRNQLRAFVTDEDHGEMHDHRLEIVDALLKSLHVHTVSATEYQAFIEDDDEARPRIRQADESGVPGLNKAIAAVARSRRESLIERARLEAAEVSATLTAEMELIRSRWEEDLRAREEVEKLSAALSDFLAPRRSELDVRKGEFRNYLKATVPAQVESRSRDASAEADKQIRTYLKRLGVKDWNYRTLQAAVSRGGTFHGVKKVDFPSDFTERLEEQIAVVWSKQLLTPMRSETRNLGKAYEKVVREIAGWAVAQGARARPQAVEKLSEQVSSEARGLAAVGGEAVDDIRKYVTGRLHEVVRAAVSRKCQEFVATRKNAGAGVKDRILDLLNDELVPTAVEAARMSATALLKEQANHVTNIVDAALQNLPDPVEGARELVVAQAERKAVREQAREREEVLAALVDLRAAMPRVTV